MYSFVDLLLISLISGAVAILLLLLASFVITSKRISRAESETLKLKGLIASKDTEIASLKTELHALEQKISNAQKTISYLAKNQDEIIDAQDDLKEAQKSFDNKVATLHKVVIQNTPENQGVLEAKRLIKEGRDLKEVASITKMPEGELEILNSLVGNKDKNKVASKESFERDSFTQVKESHDFADTKRAKDKKEPLRETSLYEQDLIKSLHKESSEIKDSLDIEMDDDLVFKTTSAKNLEKGHKVANLKARNAYGMGKSLISRNR